MSKEISKKETFGEENDGLNYREPESRAGHSIL